MTAPTKELAVFSKTAFAGRVVAITGGHSGIGFGIAKGFVECGAKGVALLGRRQEVLAKASQELNDLRRRREGSSAEDCSIGLVCDVRNYESVEASIGSVWSKWGRLDIVVNSAAGNFLCALEDLSPNAFRTVIEIDLIGTFNVSKAAFPRLRETARLHPSMGASSIINISATMHYSAARYQGHPAAAKAGVDALTRSMACEWGPEIRVNGVAPGPVAATEGLSRLAAGFEDSIIAETLPVKRIGTAEDIATSVIFLASDAAAWISGHIIVHDGGAWVGSPAGIPQFAYEQLRDSRQKAKAKL